MERVVDTDDENLLVAFYRSSWTALIQPWLNGASGTDMTTLVQRLDSLAFGFDPVPFQQGSPVAPSVYRVQKWVRKAYRMPSYDLNEGWYQRFSRVWHSREDDEEGIREIAMLLRLEEDIHAAGTVELENIGEALDFVGVPIPTETGLYLKDTEEGALRGRLVDLWRTGHNTRTFLGFEEKYGARTVEECKMAFRRIFDVPAVFALDSEDCKGMCKLLGVPPERFETLQLGMMRSLLVYLLGKPDAESSQVIQVDSATAGILGEVTSTFSTASDKGEGEPVRNVRFPWKRRGKFRRWRIPFYGSARSVFGL